MEILTELANVFRWLIRTGAVTRVSFCFFKIISDEEGISSYKKRIKNTIIFYVLAELIWVLKDLVTTYFT